MSTGSLPARLKELLATATPPQLGPGPRPGTEALPALRPRLDAVLQSWQLSPDCAALIRATILLWHDQHDASHEIVQHIESADGSYVHALLHRREPDYGNAAYWFRRVGRHPAFTALAERVGELLAGDKAEKLSARLLPGGRWEALAMVAACEEWADAPETEAAPRLLREIQRAEFETLLEHFCR